MPGPHLKLESSTPKRERGMGKGVSPSATWGALYTLLCGKNTSLTIKISEISRRPL